MACDGKSDELSKDVKIKNLMMEDLILNCFMGANMIAKDMAKSKTKTVYVCQNCGAQRPRWEGRCTDCGAWNSLVEETQSPEPVTRGWNTGKEGRKSSAPSGIKPVSLDQSIEKLEFKRLNTGYGELNRVLGGGLA